MHITKKMFYLITIHRKHVVEQYFIDVRLLVSYTVLGPKENGERVCADFVWLTTAPCGKIL